MCKGLKPVEPTFLVTDFEFGKDGFVVRLTVSHQVIENARELVGGILGGLECAEAGALRTEIIAEEGFASVKTLSG